MTEDFARRTAKISAPVAVLVLALGCGWHSPSAPTINLTPAPAPAPVSMRYHVSGIVIDDNASPIANAEVEVQNPRGYKLAQTASIPSGRLVAHSVEQLADVDPVIRQRAFAGAALLLHPSAETHEQRRKRNDPIVTMVGNEIRIREVTQE